MDTLRERLLAMAKQYDEKWRFGWRNPLDNETRQLLEDAAAEIKELEDECEGFVDRMERHHA